MAAIQAGDTVQFTLRPSFDRLKWGEAWKRRNGRQFTAVQASRQHGVWLRDTATGDQFFGALTFCQVIDPAIPDDLSEVAA
jgi:hypothetical protein